ncbi:hypothetical protein [Enterovirga sp. CN4-39]|uniref:hypothetical protein n=1 Tax=Enterovirga sp. CN4-39 TaxID=3400910 RepID=UPI003BFE3F87
MGGLEQFRADRAEIEALQARVEAELSLLRRQKEALVEALKKARRYAGMVRSSDIAGDDPIFQVLDEIDAALREAGA